MHFSGERLETVTNGNLIGRSTSRASIEKGFMGQASMLVEWTPTMKAVLIQAACRHINKALYSHNTSL